MSRLGLVIVALLLALPGVGWARDVREPRPVAWTPIAESGNPSLIVNYATMPVAEARAILEGADAATLVDRPRGVDRMVGDSLEIGAVMTFGVDARFLLRRTEAGALQFFRASSRRERDQVRLDTEDSPVLRVMAVPYGPSRRPLYDPVVVDLGERIWVVRSAQVRVRDPLDPMGTSVWGQVVFGTSFLPRTVLPDEGSYRWVITFGGPTRADPRLVALPVDAAGSVDPGREGLMLRADPPPMVDPWGRDAPSELSIAAVRLHLGDAESLAAMIRALPPPDRARFGQPGGAGDPLLVGVRGPRDPLGAGVQATTVALGELAVLNLGGSPVNNQVEPRWDGVDIAGWFGAASWGAQLRPDLVAARVGWRVGKMRDVGFTAFEVEVGSNLGSSSAPFLHSRLALNATVHASRLTRRAWWGLPVVLGTRVRAGSTGIEYDATAGLRAYAGDGWVVTPTALAGFRHSTRGQRAGLVFGLGVQGSFNANRFRR